MQPKTLFCLLHEATFDSDTNNLIRSKGIFKWTDNPCKICLFYVNGDSSFVMSNNVRQEPRLHPLTCRDINVISYLKCNMCHHKETHIRKTVGDNFVGFKSRIKQHISDCGTDISTCKFPYT